MEEENNKRKNDDEIESTNKHQKPSSPKNRDENYDEKYDARYLWTRSPSDIIIVNDETGETIIEIHKETVSNNCLAIRKMFYCNESRGNFEWPKNKEGKIIIKTDFNPETVHLFFEQVYRLPHKLPAKLNVQQLIELYIISNYYDCYFIKFETLQILERGVDDMINNVHIVEIPELIIQIYTSLQFYLQEPSSTLQKLDKFLEKIVSTYRTKWMTDNEFSIYFFCQLTTSFINDIVSSKNTLRKTQAPIIHNLLRFYIRQHWVNLDLNFFISISCFILNKTSSKTHKTWYLDKISQKIREMNQKIIFEKERKEEDENLQLPERLSIEFVCNFYNDLFLSKSRYKPILQNEKSTGFVPFSPIEYTENKKSISLLSPSDK